MSVTLFLSFLVMIIFASININGFSSYISSLHFKKIFVVATFRNAKTIAIFIYLLELHYRVWMME